jgi:hypothetical protein
VLPRHTRTLRAASIAQARCQQATPYHDVTDRDCGRSTDPRSPPAAGFPSARQEARSHCGAETVADCNLTEITLAAVAVCEDQTADDEDNGNERPPRRVAPARPRAGDAVTRWIVVAAPHENRLAIDMLELVR